MQSGPEDPGEPPLVLICDDTEAIRRLVRINLELEGFRVEEATDGKAAMTRLIDPAEPVPAVVLLDRQMSPYDGWWAIAAIRGHPPLDGVPAVLLTAASNDIDKADVLRAGFDAYVTKPFDPEVLVDVVSRLAAGGRRGRRRR